MLASRVPLLVAGVALVGQGVYAQNVQCDYLGSDVEASSAQVGWESYHVDFTPAERGPGQSGILLDGVQYKKGIFAHAPSNVVFSLDGAYQTVSGCAGIATLEDCGTPMRPGEHRDDNHGDATFSILADGDQIWSQYGAGGDHACFELTVEGVDELTFVAATAGSHSCDTASWADLKACTSPEGGGAAVHGCGRRAVAGSVATVHDVCCDGVSCVDQYPDACTQACANEFLPFYEGCESSLDDTIDTALAPLFSQCVNRPDVMAADPETCSYLGSDIAPSSTHVGWGQFVVDGTRTGAEGGNIFTPTITIGGVLYQKGIFAHASSEVVFSGLREYSTVSGCAGLADWADCGKDADHGRVTFSIVSGARHLWTSTMDGGSADGVTNCFSIELDGVEELHFIADSDGSQNCDSASWGDLKVCHESDDSCSFDNVLPAALACADTDVAGLVSPTAVNAFCSSTCAQLTSALARGNCVDTLPVGLSTIAPVIELLGSQLTPSSCGSGKPTANVDVTRQCQAALSSFGTMFTTNCCTDGSCDDDAAPGVAVSIDFIPQYCTARCEATFVPFFSDCGETVWGSEPEKLAAMRDFARICTHHTGDLSSSETCVHLGSDVEATSVEVGPMPYGVDGMWLDGPQGDAGGLVFEPGGLIIGNHAFPRGLFAHAPSTLQFDVDPTWETISGCAGIAKMCGPSSGCHCDDDCALATCGTSQDTCTQGWCHNDGHGSVTFRIRGDGDGDGSLLWSHHAQGDDGMSCFEIDLTEAGSSTIEFSVSSDGRRSCDTASWGDLKACQADSCASVASCEECNGRCGWCTAGRGQPGRCSSECQSGPNACHIGGGH